MCVETLRTGTHFSKTIDFKGHMPRFTHKIELLSLIYLLGNPINVCGYSQNRTQFSERLIWGVTCLCLLIKMNVFPCYYLGTHINVFVETLKTGLDFSETIKLITSTLKNVPSEQHSSETINEGSHACWNPHNRLKPHFSKMIDLRGHMPRFILNECFWTTLFPSFFSANPINVRGHMLKPRNKWAQCFFRDDQFEGLHA